MAEQGQTVKNPSASKILYDRIAIIALRPNVSFVNVNFKTIWQPTIFIPEVRADRKLF